MSGLLRVQALVFDLDGTLLDTQEDLANSVNHALERSGYPQRSLAEIRSMIGNGVANLVARALPAGAPAGARDEVLALFRAHYAAHMDVCTRPYPGIVPLLEELGRRRIAVAVNSNKYDAALQRLCVRFLAPHYAVAVGERPQLPKKPAPDSVLLALRHLGVPAEAAAYVGDSEVDVETAKNAKMPFIGCAWGLRGEEKLREAGAELVLSKPLDLLDLLAEA